MKHFYFYVLSIIALLFFQLSNAIAQHAHSTDKPSIHGMLIFGTEKIYASHLPMFHSPHDYQIILELELSKEDKEKFISYQQNNPKIKTYTLAPEVFVLPEMIKNPKAFKAVLYSNHFERGGKEISDSITVKIAKVVYFKKFDSTVSEVKNTLYLLFGNEKEQFAAHIIAKKPDFDHIHQIETELANENETIEIITNDEENTVLGTGGNETSFLDKNGEKHIVFWLNQLYLEFDDLK